MDVKRTDLRRAREIPRLGRASSETVRRIVVAAACVQFFVASAGAIGQDAEALRQLDTCKSASRMVNDAHGVSAATTSRAYERMALAACGKAIELFGTRQEGSEAYYTRGLVYMRKSEYELAIADLTKAIEFAPTEDWQAYWWRAYARNMKASFSAGDERLKENTLALADADRAIALNPMEPMLYHNRASMRGAGEETLASADRAMGACVDAITLGHDLLPRKGWKATTPPGDPADGALSKAILPCKHAVDLNSTDWVAMYLRGWGYVGQREYGLAATDFSKAIELSPEKWRAHAYKARGLAKEGNGEIEAAISDFRKSLQLRPHDDSAKAALDRTAGVRK